MLYGNTYELTRHIHSRHEVDTHACEDCQPKSDKSISFDEQKGHYDLKLSDVNLDYWLEVSDTVVSKDDPPNADSHREEEMMDYTTDNWLSDDEETLPTHPEMVTTPSLILLEAWEDHYNDTYHYSGTHEQTLLDTEDTNDQLVHIKEFRSINDIMFGSGLSEKSRQKTFLYYTQWYCHTQAFQEVLKVTHAL